jgi:hypothetical protein
VKQAGEILLKKSNREERSAGAQESRLLNADEYDFERLRCGTVGEHNSRKINRGPAVRKPERRKSQRPFCRRNPGRNSDALIQDRRLEGHLAHIHAALQKARRKTCLRSPGNLASCTSWKAACRRAATIGPRFSDASLVTAAWLITARGPGTLEGDQR